MVLVFLKASLMNRDWGKQSNKYLSYFCVFCNQLPCPIQQWAHTFPSLHFLADKPIEVLVALHTLNIPYHIQLQVGFGFPKPIPECSDSIYIFLLDHLSLFPSAACFFFYFKFSWQLCSSKQASYHLRLPIHGEGLFLGSEKILGPVFSPEERRSHIVWDLSKCVPEQAKSPASWCSGLWYSCILPHLPFRMLNSTSCLPRLSTFNHQPVLPCF